MNKYNFKVGDKVQIYRKPVNGLGVSVSCLPPIGAEGVVSLSSVNDYHSIEGLNIPYVRIRFDDKNHNVNDSFDWGIPCSCLKRVKEEKIIKVAAEVDLEGSPICIGVSGEGCNYYHYSNCVESGRFPACSEEGIIYMKVKNDT